MAKAKFLLQGLNEKDNHRIAFAHLKSVENIQNVLISTAFLSSEGVEVIKEELKYFKSNVTIYVGNRNGITSVQGVKGLLEIGIQPYLIDTGTNAFIFHPKSYLACSDKNAISIVGSANLTLGGLVKNIEASDVLELDINDEDDKKYVESMKQAFVNLRVNYPENVIQVMSNEQADKLLQDGKLIDERISKPCNVGTSSSHEKSITPSMKTKIEDVSNLLKEKKKIKTDKTTSATSEETTKVQMIGSQWVELWKSDSLKERDLNIPTGDNTHATGSMTLRKGGYANIDQRTYFRYEVFNGLNWSKGEKESKSHLEYASADFYIVIEGVNCGKYTLVIKHDTRTNSASYNQNNAMTHLLWKDAKQFVANRKLIGKKLRIYKIEPSNNEFVVEISEADVSVSAI